MRYPNKRYGNPEELRYYTMMYQNPIKEIAKKLRRSERSVRDWLTGAKRVPWWVPEILRLQKKESEDIFREMTGRKIAARHGIAKPGAIVFDFVKPKSEPEAPKLTPTPLADADDEMYKLRNLG